MSEENLFQLVANELNLKLIQVENTVELLDQGNTVPFISRYRKEKTGSLDEDQIRLILIAVCSFCSKGVFGINVQHLNTNPNTLSS